MRDIPETVAVESRDIYEHANESRQQIKEVAREAKRLAGLIKVSPMPAGEPNEDRSEAIANAMLAYRHLEDASMRLGKVLQALDGGVSVYDRATTVGA